jgi:putative transposase
MKTDNSLWRCRKISDKLKKLDIDIHHTTVNKMIQTFRREGKIQPTGSWKKFLKSNWDSLFGMDFMTIDTLFGKRFYLLIILELKSRKIVRFNLTENPCREFVK